MTLSTPNTNSRALPACGVISSFQSLRDALRGEAREGLVKEFEQFLEDATPEEIAFLSEALSVRNQCTSDADSDGFRLASAIEWTAGNTRAIPIPGSPDDENEPVLGWATVTNEETKQPTEGAVV
ncbi:MAG: hypothetical protein INH43_05800 [Acidobacteriaceae bacterium]|jgi:hypothetical protein|nr:hypothetical protein [Acidobacteriaceae bacterium]